MNIIHKNALGLTWKGGQAEHQENLHDTFDMTSSSQLKLLERQKLWLDSFQNQGNLILFKENDQAAAAPGTHNPMTKRKSNDIETNNKYMRREMSNQQSSSTDIVHCPSPPRLLNRSKGLRKLGVDETDVHLAEKLLEQIKCPNDPKKAERILGYASERLAREKALRTLGTNEEEVQLENAKNLGSLGVAGRRRSFVVLQPPSHELTKSISKAWLRKHTGADQFRKTRRHTFHSIKQKYRRLSVTEKRRRSSDSEIRRLRNEARASASEIELLKAKLEELEKRIEISSASTGPAMIED